MKIIGRKNICTPVEKLFVLYGDRDFSTRPPRKIFVKSRLVEGVILHLFPQFRASLLHFILSQYRLWVPFDQQYTANATACAKQSQRWEKCRHIWHGYIATIQSPIRGRLSLKIWSHYPIENRGLCSTKQAYCTSQALSILHVSLNCNSRYNTQIRIRHGNKREAYIQNLFGLSDT
jgi:hypothetical protein